MFSLVQKLELQYCYRCNERIENYKVLSIDHIKSWLHVSTDLFWDIDNIAFSHLSCNSATSSAATRIKHPSSSSYSAGCRCNACRKCKSMYEKYRRWRIKYESK